MAWFSNSPSVLRRWAALSEEPLPENFSEYAARSTSEAFRIQAADPELVSILTNRCGAGLKADVLENKFDPVAPTAEQLAETARQAEVQALFEAKPFESGNLTQQMMLRAMSPDLASQQEAAAAPDPGNPDLVEARKKGEQAEEQRIRRESLLKGMSQSKAIYERNRIRRQMAEYHARLNANLGQQGDD